MCVCVCVWLHIIVAHYALENVCSLLWCVEMGLVDVCVHYAGSTHVLRSSV